MNAPYTNDKTADALTPEAARGALLRIATILDGDPNEPGVEWSQDEIEWVAEVMTSLGFVIRSPGTEYED